MHEIILYKDKNGESEIEKYINKFILLSMFLKQTQKTPKKEIEKAKKLLEDYKKRSDKNE